jgi:hypothetical protein
MGEYEYDLFLGCAGEDLEFAQRLRARLQQEHLEGQPLRVFLYKSRKGARTDILPGETFPIAIDRALKASRVFGYILSPASVRSKWVVHKEYAPFTVLADEDPQRYIIPLLRQDCDPLSYVAALQRIDFRDDTRFEEKVEELLHALRHPPGLRVLGTPKPPPERMRRTILEDLKDLAWKEFLQEFVELYLMDDRVRWEVVSRGKTSPDEQALAVFTIYNRQGENGLQKLYRKISAYERTIH